MPQRKKAAELSWNVFCGMFLKPVSPACLVSKHTLNKAPLLKGRKCYPNSEILFCYLEVSPPKNHSIFI